MSKKPSKKDIILAIFLIVAVAVSLFLFIRGFNGDKKTDEELSDKVFEDFDEEAQADDAPEISSHALRDLIESDKEFVILNPESRENYHKKHIPGSQSFPHDEIVANIAELPMDQIVIVSSSGDESGCNLSSKISRLLMSEGYPDVRDHTDGWIGWEKLGYPTVTQDEINVPKISGDTLEQKIKDNEDIVIFDLRDAEEYAKKHIPGAENIPFFEFANNRDSIPHNRFIVLYDADSTKADIAAQELITDRYTQVKTLVGGFDEWVLEERLQK
ncbi:hypothetical protein KKH43_04945 [Patescibacteria group bacterium]|nr:hypothetical protein [Patescibacteria group bacterium]